MVMRIIQPQRLAEGIAQAGHPGLAGPVEPGQGLVGAECIKGRIVWHILPVDTSHILTPLRVCRMKSSIPWLAASRGSAASRTGRQR